MTSEYPAERPDNAGRIKTKIAAVIQADLK
jgi:hypothetical protein